MSFEGIKVIFEFQKLVTTLGAGKKVYGTIFGAGNKAYYTKTGAGTEAYCTKTGAEKGYLWLPVESKQSGKLASVMSKYHKMDTNEYLNLFGGHIMYRMNIQMYSDATFLPNEYPNIFVFRK